MYGKLKEFLTNELEGIKAAGLYKNERIITTPQRADIKVNAGSDVLNFCANNYLGLSDNQRLIKAAKEAMDTHGYACRPFVSSVERRICTSNWKQPSPTISRLRTRSFTPHVSTLTVVCSSHCSARKTLSSRMP
jgi:hypothetical protein